MTQTTNKSTKSVVSSTKSATSNNKSATKEVVKEEKEEKELKEVSLDNAITVYRKKSTFKGATDTDFWYSGTRADGASVIFKFKCDIGSDSSAFIVSDVIGNFKKEEVVVKGLKYINYTYYVNECTFTEIEGEPLPL